MKNNGTTTILNWALLAGAVVLLISGIKYYNKSKTERSYRVLIGQFSGLQNSENLLRGLVAESLEYAKTNPSMTPVLDSILSNKPKAPAAPTTAKPLTK